MTVEELIEILQKMPLDLPVVALGEHVNECIINEEYYDCDSARPDAWTITVVELV